MVKLRNKFAIGCIIQWYEIEILETYLLSVKNAIKNIENKENVIIDLHLDCSESLEKVDTSQITISEIKLRYYKLLNDIFGYDEDTVSLVECDYNIKSFINDVEDNLHTIADYRREFNDKYCTEVDVLMWGETDSLIPRQNFEVLDLLHTNNISQGVYKYLVFFGGCKMWDDSWKSVEHTDFTDKPFIQDDNDNWWSLRYNMTIDEMNKINDKVDELDVRVVNPYKFNGCGLVMSSDVIKAGVNIPKSAFFVHEDTAFMHSLIHKSTRLIHNEMV